MGFVKMALNEKAKICLIAIAAILILLVLVFAIFDKKQLKNEEKEESKDKEESKEKEKEKNKEKGEKEESKEKDKKKEKQQQEQKDSKNNKDALSAKIADGQLKPNFKGLPKIQTDEESKKLYDKDIKKISVFVPDLYREDIKLPEVNQKNDKPRKTPEGQATLKSKMNIQKHQVEIHQPAGLPINPPINPLVSPPLMPGVGINLSGSPANPNLPFLPSNKLINSDIKFDSTTTIEKLILS